MKMAFCVSVSFPLTHAESFSSSLNYNLSVELIMFSEENNSHRFTLLALHFKIKADLLGSVQNIMNAQPAVICVIYTLLTAKVLYSLANLAFLLCSQSGFEGMYCQVSIK